MHFIIPILLFIYFTAGGSSISKNGIAQYGKNETFFAVWNK